MGKILKYIALTLFIFQLLSCSKNKDYVDMIPADAEFVVQINPKTIAEKGNFKALETYQWVNIVQQEIQQTDPALHELVQQIKKSPTSSGLDLISPLYIFGRKHQQKVIATLVMNMNKKSDFEAQLKVLYKGIYKKEISFVEKGNYTFIEGQKKPFMAWNDKQFMFIASEFGTSTTVMDQYFESLCQAPTSLRSSSNSFADFLKKAEDLNIWYTGKFVDYFNVGQPNEPHGIDLSKSAWATYVSFNQDNISFIQKFHPDPATKIKMEKRPVWKSKINSEIFKYFPKQSFLNVGFAVHASNAKNMFTLKNPITTFIQNYDIDPSILANSAEGEVLLSVFDFEGGQTFNVKDYFGKKDQFAQKVIIPQFILAGKMKDQLFYEHLIATLKENLTKDVNYYTFRATSHLSLYITQKDDVLFITNNHIQLTNFINNRVEKINFIQSDFSNGAKNPLFAHINLNLSEYPQEVTDYFFHQIPFGQTDEIQNFARNIEYIKFNVTDEYTKNGEIKFKHTDKNSLELLLKFMDHSSTLFFNPPVNPQNNSYESNQN